MIDFISRPLLKSDSIYREIRAVNSEHQMNKNRDVRRKWQIFYSGEVMWSNIMDRIGSLYNIGAICSKNFQKYFFRKSPKITPDKKIEFLTPICKLWTKNPQTGYIVERHLWTKNPHEIQKFVFGNVVEGHLWTKIHMRLGTSWSVVCG